MREGKMGIEKSRFCPGSMISICAQQWLSMLSAPWAVLAGLLCRHG